MAQDKMTFHRRWYELLHELDGEKAKNVLMAVVRFAFEYVTPTLEDAEERAVFRVIKSDIGQEWSHKLEISRKRSAAGRSGGAPRFNYNARKGGSSETDTQTSPEQPRKVEVVQSTLIADEIPEQKPKPTKPQKKHYAPTVLLTDGEFNKLCEQHGEEAVRWMIQKLDDYKAARGTTYKSDYRAILNWVVNEYRKQHYNGGSTTNWQSDNGANAKMQRFGEYAAHLASKLGYKPGDLE